MKEFVEMLGGLGMLGVCSKGMLMFFDVVDCLPENSVVDPMGKRVKTNLRFTVFPKVAWIFCCFFGGGDFFFSFWPLFFH